MLRTVSRSRKNTLFSTTVTNCPACLESVKIEKIFYISTSTSSSTSNRQFNTSSSYYASTSSLPLHKSLDSRTNSITWSKNGSNKVLGERFLTTDARIEEVELEESVEEAYGREAEEDILLDEDSAISKLIESIEAIDNASTSAPLISSSSTFSSSTNNKPHRPSPPPSSSPPFTLPPVIPKITSQTLMMKRSIDYSAPPTHLDLDNCRPRRRVVIPTFESTPSVRTIYKKTYEQSINRISSSFVKGQIAIFVGPREKGGLGLDLTLPEIKSAFIGRKPKFWKCKTVEQMSKNELIKVIMALSWGMPHPDNIAAPVRTIPVTINIPLPDRTLFLLLTPDSTAMATLSKTYGIKLSFHRDNKTGSLFLVLKGGKESVAEAQEDVETIAENCQQRDIELPDLATVLRPEIYQAISRISKTYLEPGPKPNTITATARNSAMIDATETLLLTAFAKHATQTSTPIFASLSHSIPLKSIKYALYPFAPSTTPSWLAGATTFFSRLRTVSVPDSAIAADEDFTDWSGKLNLTRTRLNLTQGGKDLITVLLKPFESSSALKYTREEENVLEEDGEVLELRGSFGHLVWPLYPNNNISKESEMGMGPVLNGDRDFDDFSSWFKSERNLSGSFMPAPPSGFLANTGVTTPIDTPSPFAAILSGISPSASSDIDLGPTTISRHFRRVVYTPLPESLSLSSKSRSKTMETLEIELQGRNNAVVASRILVERGVTQVLVPEGACDVQLTVSKVTTLPDDSVALSLDTMENPPEQIRYNGKPYLLESNRFVHLSVVSPPSKTPLSQMLTLPSISPAKTLTYLQERWSDITSGSTGVSVEVLLGDSKPSTGFETGLNFYDKCQKGLEIMEAVARKPYITVADSGLSQKVFRAKSTRGILG